MNDRSDIKNEVVLPGMLCTDEVHLNSNGNRALSKAIIRTVAHKWLSYNRPLTKGKGLQSNRKVKSWSKKKAAKAAKKASKVGDTPAM